MNVLRFSRSERMHVVLLAVVALGLRVYGLTDGLWLDEANTAWRVVSLRSTLTLNDGSPFFYPLTVWLCTSLFGESDGVLRLSSLVAGVLLPPCVFLLLKQRLDVRTSMVAAWLVVLAPSGIFYSIEARAYSLLSLLCFLFVAFSWLLATPRADRKVVSRPLVVATLVSGLAMVLTHNYGLFACAAVAVVCASYLRAVVDAGYQRSAIKAFIAIFTIMAGVWLVVCGPYLTEASRWVRQAAANNPEWPHPSVDVVVHAMLTTPLGNFQVAGLAVLLALATSSAALIGLALAGPLSSPGRYWAWIYLVMMACTAANNWRLPHFVPNRYEVGFASVLLVTVAVALSFIKPNAYRTVAAIGVGCYLMMASYQYWAMSGLGRSATANMAQRVVQARADVLLVTLQRRFDPLYLPSMTYYLHRRLKSQIPVIEIPRFRLVPDGFVSPTHYYLDYPELVAVSPEAMEHGLQASLVGRRRVALLGHQQDLPSLVDFVVGQGYRVISDDSQAGWRDGGVSRLVILERLAPASPGREAWPPPALPKSQSPSGTLPGQRP